ncbi:MAG TPA: hypothetical protein VMQ83_03685 [Gammaproteobacteria bacterium]|nr:hypothetical protein [Gammaproteobacteria bacterium]
MSKKRFGVFRDVVVFQVKLVVDGLRDVLLSPLSIFAALIDLLIPGDDGGKRFYSVVRFGRRTEQWINLFGAADAVDPEASPQGVDVLLNDLEALVRDPQRRDEARSKAQALLDRLRQSRGPQD